MSRPPSFVPPPGTRALRLSTARGDFAAIASPAVTGHTKGTALLLPGFTGSKEDFIALHTPLAAAGYRTVAVDGRGQFESDGPRDDETPYAQEQLARDVIAQATAVSGAFADDTFGEGAFADGSFAGGTFAGDTFAGGPVHLLGHSLGGLVARAAVLLDVAPFRSLTLMASGPAQISPSQQERVKLLRDALTVMDMAQVWAAIQSMEPPPPEDTASGAEVPGLDQGLDDADDLRRRWLLTSPSQLIVTGRQLCVEPDRVGELAALPLPKHVISGERDDTWPLPLLDDMAVRLGARRTVVRGAEHSPNTDRPQETAAALAAFWDTVD
ncbi:alpha/beta fold hydrolase [Streptomyces sp. NPDC058001]|uniref:alpha/beta fold hydrolase n=1 Tax=Streptomyces sp. NPDC058001 TaxID=3346300 RepID=UPI0036E2978F